MIISDKKYIKTPRGNIRINEIFKSEKEATNAGYGIWFTHDGIDIYAHSDPCLKAIVSPAEEL